ncbi:IPT/TIG domain-containing protein [Micromonospora krabiensis]|uniref:IPT/TIG domain-containing protein n=1 Tax=Micromonospora krabiensis TaxID=307121 RepID=A0A1C3MXF5_9ACTN|nr:IPT/TIG domain-containing protein [Micromonospora krabiensis]SBV24998.1 IPT/TIG domain-containing protein [Micromonospora krabiensis]
MGSVRRRLSVLSVGLLVAGAAGLGLARPALAAPGDAAARGVVLDLVGDPGDESVQAQGTFGSVTAPPGGGTDDETSVAVALADPENVTATGTVAQVSATRGPTTSTASSQLATFTLSVLGVEVLDVAGLGVTAQCSAGNTSAGATGDDIAVFGQQITIRDTAQEFTADVTVTGLTDATLRAVVDRQLTGTPDNVIGINVRAVLSVSGFDGVEPAQFSLGQVILAEASCQSPTAVAPTASAISPNSGPQAGGQPVTITGTGFVPNATLVAFDGVAATNVVVAADGSSLTAVTPPGTVGPAAVVVSTAGGSAPALSYTYLAPAVTPRIESLTPEQGSTDGGTVVTVRGGGFVSGRTTVGICGQTIPAGEVTVAADARSLTFRTPPCAVGATEVRVTTPAGTSNEITFHYQASLPVTGTSLGGPVAAGLAMLLTGAVLLLATRHRRQRV